MISYETLLFFFHFSCAAYMHLYAYGIVVVSEQTSEKRCTEVSWMLPLLPFRCRSSVQPLEERRRHVHTETIELPSGYVKIAIENGGL